MEIAFINLSNKGKYTRLCHGGPIRAGILVAIMGPPEMEEIIKRVYQLYFYTNGAKETMCKSTLRIHTVLPSFILLHRK